MQNLIRRGNTWFARFYVPQDRWADVGKATASSGGIKREVVRTLKTSDRKEARRRLNTALTAIQADIDAALERAHLPPLTDWTANWADRAVEIRAALRAADDTRAINPTTIPLPTGEVAEIGETERDMLRDSFRADAEHLEEVRGSETAEAFWKAVNTEQLTLREAIDMWLHDVGEARTQKTIDGHRKVFSDLETFLRERWGQQSLAALTFPDVTRRMAGEFISWRRSQVSPAAVKRECSAPMGLWRWAIRRGHAEVNPWTDQTAGLGTADSSEEDGKRPFTTSELVTLLHATGDEWAPNGGGYGATLWDATRLGLLTGLRVSELANLTIRDLDDSGTVVRVRKGKSKNARRIVPLPRVAQDVFAKRIAELPHKRPHDPLWPELPVLRQTSSRGGKLSDRFRVARERLLSNSDGVDFHSLRRNYITFLEAAMNKDGRINPALIASLVGHARGTLALDLYSGGPELAALRAAVEDMERLGLPAEVREALTATICQRPNMVRFEPHKGTSEAKPAPASE